jgi:tRNA nucleotidyltransferase (CCA-adding enzyme)
VFIQVLRDCGALARLLPEVDALFGVPQPAAHHPEVDTGAHLLLALAQAAALSDSTEVRFAVLVHDLGKGATPEQEWPRHIAHEHRGAAMVERLCRRIKAPNRYRELALAVCRYHTHCHRALELRGRTLLKLLQGVDALRRPERLEPFLLACEADARGRGGLQDRPYPQADHLRRALAAAAAVSAAQFQGQGLTGRRLGEAIHAERVRLLEELACAPGGGGAGGG